MLPYLAQGAGSSLEDGAALGILLSQAKSREDLPRLLKLYEEIRKPRSSALQRRSMKQVRELVGTSVIEHLRLIDVKRHTNHLPNGSEQQERDLLLEQQFNDPQRGYPFYWYGEWTWFNMLECTDVSRLDPADQEFVYGYNVFHEVCRTNPGVSQN